MTDEDRTRWNEKYRAGEHSSSEPSILLTELDPLLPNSGRAIDIAGGTGRHALWLARRGLDVTVADISDVALEIAQRRAAQANLSMATLQIDLEQEPFPAGPWDLIVSVHYLWRPLFEMVPTVLSLGGIFVCIQPTMSNLTRHEKPSARFLLADDELPRLVSRMQTLYYQEGWLAEGRHEAVIVARNPGSDVQNSKLAGEISPSPESPGRQF
jgi:tellurite methyltransferase